MPQTVLKEFSLPIDIKDFVARFWLDSAWYENFLVAKLEDINVSIGEWREESSEIKTRDIKCYHPSKISFPGLPSHAEVFLCLSVLNAANDIG